MRIIGVFSAMLFAGVTAIFDKQAKTLEYKPLSITFN